MSVEALGGAAARGAAWRMDGGIVKSGDFREADERCEDCLRSGRPELNLAALKLELFPGDVFGASRFLRTLNLRNNSLEYLPSNLDLLACLEILNLSHNKLRAVPALPVSLEKLNLDHNKLAELDASIGRLERLRELYVRNNRLLALCPELSECVRLETFEAGNNLIERFPAGFDSKRLPNLRVVDFSGNPVKQWPWSIQCLQEAHPILTSAEERRKLVKRNLRTKAAVNRKLLV